MREHSGLDLVPERVGGLRCRRRYRRHHQQREYETARVARSLAGPHGCPKQCSATCIGPFRVGVRG